MSARVRYRVWCVSWEDEEEYGSDVVGYDFLTHDFEKQERGVVYIPGYSLADAGDAAEAYADYAHDHRDGYECTWPLVFRVRCPDGSVEDFEVGRDFVTEFSAHPARSKVTASATKVETESA